MIKMCMEPAQGTAIWDAAEDAISLSYQFGGQEVLLLFESVLLRVKSGRDSISDVYTAYETKRSRTLAANGRH